MLTPAELAALHHQCFETPRPWSEKDFAGYLSADRAFVICEADLGFILGRVVADEAELLTLAVAPHARRKGVARKLLRQFEAEAQERGAETAFLEVAVFNASAQGLYESEGWCESGLRRRYYTSPTGEKIDALMLAKAFVSF